MKTILRRARTLLWTAASIVIILAAVVVGIGKLLMPYSDRFQPKLETWLSEEFGRPVTLEGFTGDWKAFGPRLSLRGMTLEAEAGRAGEVAIEEAALDVKPLNALIPGRPLYNFRVIGAHFELQHKADGTFELSGFGVSGRGSEGSGSALRELATVGEVHLQGSSLGYVDEKHQIRLSFSSVDGRLQMDGDDLSAEIQAALDIPESGLVYGEIEATVLLKLQDGRAPLEAHWRLTARELMLAAFQGRLPANPFLPLTGWLNADLWGEWNESDGHLIRGVSDLRDARLVNEYQDLGLERINTRFKWAHRQAGGWRMDLVEFLYDDGQASWTAPNISMARDTARDLGLWISADHLPLDVPLNLARDVMSIYKTKWPRFLPRSASGTVSGLDLVLDSRWRLQLARGSVANASVYEWDRWPDLQGLDGEVSLFRGYGSLSLKSPRLLADWPRMFRDRLAFTLPGCELDLKWGGSWQVGFRDCRLENEDLAVKGDVLLSGDEGKPKVDVNVAVLSGNAGNLDSYWPEAVMKEPVKRWLRHGLAGGTIETGHFQIHGDMDDWPFRQGKGRFEAVATVSDGVIDYTDGWPRAEDVDATAHFLGASMAVRGSVGSMAGVAVKSARASIGELKRPVLKLSYASDSPLPRLLEFVQQTPLDDNIDIDLSRFDITGPATTTGELTFPLGSAEGELAVDGRVSIEDGRFAEPDWDIELTAITGDLRYDHRGFRGEALSGFYKGLPASLDISAGLDGPHRFRTDMSGTFDVRDVIPAFLVEGYSALAQVEGVSDWFASVIVDAREAGESASARLELNSGLEGVELALPAPLNKPADSTWPLYFNYPLTGESRELNLELRDRATFSFDLPGDAETPRRALIRLGGGSGELPPPGLIRIAGEAAELDLDGWIDVAIEGARQGKGLGGLDLEPGRMGAAGLRFLDRMFADVIVEFEAAENTVRAGFTAEDIEGKVQLTGVSGGSRSLSAEFERLVLADPITKGVELDMDPADLPALHLYARSLEYIGIAFGETRIEAYPTSAGFHFEKVEADSGIMDLRASGDWLLDEGRQRSDFEIHLSSESLGDFLQAMDISSALEGGQTIVHFSAWWPGPPAAFALSRLNGAVEFSVVDGMIANASPGAGRLLGLLSVQSLPRRLALDFRDVFDSGFTFDDASGTFVMENGTARTEDVELRSSSANISLSGETNLVEKRYDQLMTVRPGLGSTLPVIGAIAGGPGGAAAGLALQGLLHEQLGEATQVQYTITGDWDSPSIEPVLDQAENNRDSRPEASGPINGTNQSSMPK